MIAEHKKLEDRFVALVADQPQLRNLPNKNKLQENQTEVHAVAEQLRLGTQALVRNLKVGCLIDRQPVNQPMQCVEALSHSSYFTRAALSEQLCNTLQHISPRTGHSHTCLALYRQLRQLRLCSKGIAPRPYRLAPATLITKPVAHDNYQTGLAYRCCMIASLQCLHKPLRRMLTCIP